MHFKKTEKPFKKNGHNALDIACMMYSHYQVQYSKRLSLRKLFEGILFMKINIVMQDLRMVRMCSVGVLFFSALLATSLLDTLQAQAISNIMSKRSYDDYLGTPFVTQKAPMLKFNVRTSPKPEGINYPFKEQTAHGVCLFNRFPPFTLSDRKVFISGPWYDTPSANGEFTHGITAIMALPNFRQGSTDVSHLPRTEKWELINDPLVWTCAAQLADKLRKTNPGDDRIPALLTLANDHKFTPNKQAYLALGEYLWEGERYPTDSDGQGVLYPSLDIEETGGWDYQRECFGWLYQGMIEAAAKYNLKLIPITYGQWTFDVGAYYESMRQNGNGYPEYLLPEKDFLASPDPTLKACEETGGVVSMDGYIQAIWGDEPFYKRNTNGTLIISNGQPVYNDITETHLYGTPIRLEKNEAKQCLQDIYRQALRMYLMYYRLAGDYPDSSLDRKPFLKDVQIGAWTRITNEGMQGIQQNDRPLPGWLMEMMTGMYLMTADDIVVWSSDFNNPPGPLGGDYTKTWKYNTQGVMEYLVKAMHRYSVMDPIHHGAFQWCWFNLPLVNKNETDGDQYYQKPIAIGKIREYHGKPWLELYVAFPAMDNQSSTMRIWVDKSNKKSPIWTIKIPNGRNYFYDAWEIPGGFKGLKGRNVYLQYHDAMGIERTERGDWRLNPL